MSTWTGAGEAVGVSDVEVVVGRVGRPHGVRGEVSVDVRTDKPERRFAPGTQLHAEQSENHETLTVSAVRRHGARLLVSFQGITDRTAADSLRGANLLAPPMTDAAELTDPEEYYDHQLVGLVVRRPDGERVGKVRDVLHLPSQEVLVVGTDGGGEALVPFVTALVPCVDLVSGSVMVEMLPGLLSDAGD